GHDFRYALSTKKVRRELGWRAKTRFAEGLRKTVDWYLENFSWVEEKIKEERAYFRRFSKFYLPERRLRR
ncbi:MAG: hypothetical protein ABIK84_06215, partial [candidate division WOR-3 bacterium]